MLNLILNAVEAMSGSSETAREPLIRTEQDGPGGLLVAVQDSGPGLKPDSLDRLFDPVYTTKPSGMGMGLSICRSIIEAHGGRVWPRQTCPRAPPFSSPYPSRGRLRPKQALAARRRFIHGLEIGGLVAPRAGRGSLKLGAQTDRGLSSQLGVSRKCRILSKSKFRLLLFGC
jgi:signal transduction histidine kinase